LIAATFSFLTRHEMIAAYEKFRRIELALEKQNVSQAVQSAIVDGVN
jgi:hypothetical protein